MTDAYTSWKQEDLDPKLRDRYEVTPTGDEGFTSGRARFKVVCKECQNVLHENTTGPGSYIKDHEDFAHKPLYLSFEQSQALKQLKEGELLQLIDPQTKKVYVLVPKEIWDSYQLADVYKRILEEGA